MWKGIIPYALDHHVGTVQGVAAVEDAPRHFLARRPAISKHAANVALEGFRVKRAAAFGGATCVSYVAPRSPHPYNETSFACGAGARLADDKVVQASIELPATIFQAAGASAAAAAGGQSFKVQFIVYRNAKLFPLTNTSQHAADKLVTTSVISSRIVDLDEVTTTLEQPVTVQLRMPLYTENATAVYWNSSANGGYGDWETDGCEITGQDGNLSIIHCTHLTDFAILQCIEVWFMRKGFNRD
ncbi:PREDICTED: adhesion G protein-coupled receptor A3-like [Priapulus caudatus]|uniref:Adhesion G protein-coupled receptor A3-like n=1 Tax=Priapulus caudatus TaxID=37621 RepID=A0ABM1EPI0_PRICU|nr:PREDICTED: adhesion G protein-coupled receptor A3-like [Priapulus caudatus]